MGIGLLWCFCAGLCLYGVKKAEEGKKGILIAFSLCFAFFGICGVLGNITENEVLLYTSRILSISVLCFALFIKLVLDKKTCTTEVTGVYQGYHMQKSVRGYCSYSPIFLYYFQGREYQGMANENYSLKKISARFIPGQSYTIFLNEKNPCQYVTGNSQLGNKILLLAVGLFMLFGYVILIMQ